MPKKKHYLYSDKKELDIRFYDSYDEKFLLHKAKTLLLVADAPEAFRDFVSQGGGDIAIEGDDKTYAQELRAEVHFTEFHQFEAFFALLVALFQPLPHWLYLTTYTTQEFKTKVEQYLAGDILGLTNGVLSDRHEFINQTIYTNFIPPDCMATGNAEEDEACRAKWRDNLDNIAWLLERLARKYVDGAEYNGYKHGLRVMAGPVFFRMFANDANGNPGPLVHNWEPEDALRFLETKEVPREEVGAPPEVEGTFWRVSEVSKGFNPKESINHLNAMSFLLETLKKTRLAILKDEKEGMTLHTCFNLDRAALRELQAHEKWSVTL